MLTQSELKRIFNYNLETGLFTRLVANNNYVKVGETANCHTRGYIRIKIADKSYKAHRLAWLYVTGAFPKNEVDHINGVRDDNCWENLRDVTRAVNSQNQRKPKINNASGYLGVTLVKTTGKWRAKITVNYKVIYLGYFDHKHEAAAHYLQKKRELHIGCSI